MYKIYGVYQVFHFQRACICPSFGISVQNTLHLHAWNQVRSIPEPTLLKIQVYIFFIIIRNKQRVLLQIYEYSGYWSTIYRIWLLIRRNHVDWVTNHKIKLRRYWTRTNTLKVKCPHLNLTQIFACKTLSKYGTSWFIEDTLGVLEVTI